MCGANMECAQLHADRVSSTAHDCAILLFPHLAVFPVKDPALSLEHAYKHLAPVS